MICTYHESQLHIISNSGLNSKTAYHKIVRSRILCAIKVPLINLLILKSCKTEFLLVGLSKQLAKINNSSLTTTHSVETLAASYLMNTSLFLTRSHLCPNLAITIFVTWFTESPSIVRCACRLARKPSVDVVRTSSASLSYSSFTSSLKNCSSSSDRRNATRSSSEIYRPRTYNV